MKKLMENNFNCLNQQRKLKINQLKLEHIIFPKEELQIIELT